MRTYRNIFQVMHFIFNQNQRASQSSTEYPLPNRFSFSAYSNLGYISTSDLTVDVPCIYSIRQDYQLENDIDVII